MNGHICQPSWGIGIYNYKDPETGEQVSGYGYASPENPNDFIPDFELCTEKEISDHKIACLKWDLKIIEDFANLKYLDGIESTTSFTGGYAQALRDLKIILEKN